MFGGGEYDIAENIKTKTNENKSKHILVRQQHLCQKQINLWDKSSILTAAEKCSRRFTHHNKELSTEWEPQPLFLVQTRHSQDADAVVVTFISTEDKKELRQ